jgi:hypothetical protein
MIDPHDAVRERVLAIFRELAGDRAKLLDPSVLATPAMDAMTASLAADHGWEKGADVAFHLADWNWDAAFIVALHLFPERFTPEEINAGIGLFLIHAPNHIREACRLTDTYVWESFPDDTEGQSLVD